MAFIDPFVMVAVAVAVVYVPTLPSDCVNVPIPDTGPEIFTETVPLKPEPALVISNYVTEPAADTIAVADAPTFISPEEIKASTLLYVKLYLSAKGMCVVFS